jgi:hypothetical protein
VDPNDLFRRSSSEELSWTAPIRDDAEGADESSTASVGVGAYDVPYQTS